MTDAPRPSPADLAAILDRVDNQYEDVLAAEKRRSARAGAPHELTLFAVEERRMLDAELLVAEVRALQQELRVAKEGAAHLAQRQIMDEAWGGGIRDVDDSLRDNPPADAKYFCRVCPECGCALQDKYHAPDCYYHCPCGIDSLSGTQPERWVTAEGKPLTQYEMPRWDSGHAPPFPHPFDVEEGTATC